MEAQAAALNEDVLKHASVEWRPLEEGEDGGAAQVREIILTVNIKRAGSLPQATPPSYSARTPGQ